MRAKAYCISYGCLNNDKDRNLTFFSLPQDIERRQQWLRLVDREELLHKENTNRKTYLVCSAHFEDSSIKIIKHLKKDAVPTKLLPKQSQDSSSSSEDQSPPEQIKDKVITLSNVKKSFTVGTQTESLLSTEQTQTSTFTDEGNDDSRKRKLADKLKEYQLKRRRLDHEIVKIMMELEP